MRIVEIYTGAYASGKTENSINRAVSYIKSNKPVTLVDFDTVEPAYCMRPIEKKLRDTGINLILQSDYFGLGEAGGYVTKEQINCLKINKGDIIIDVGYGVGGLDTLDLIEGIDEEENLIINLVVNTSKFETKDVSSILEYIEFNKGEDRKNRKITSFILNTHLGDETTKEDIIKGFEILDEVSKITNIPIKAISIDRKLENEFNNEYKNIPVRILDRYMKEALW